SYERPRYISCAKPFYLKQVHSAPSALKTGAASEPQARAAPASGLGDHAVDGITPVREPQAAQRTDLERVDCSRRQVLDDCGLRTGNELLGPCGRRSAAAGNRAVTQLVDQRFQDGTDLDFHFA